MTRKSSVWAMPAFVVAASLATFSCASVASANDAPPCNSGGTTIPANGTRIPTNASTLIYVAPSLPIAGGAAAAELFGPDKQPIPLRAEKAGPEWPLGTTLLHLGAPLATGPHELRFAGCADNGETTTARTSSFTAVGPAPMPTTTGRLRVLKTETTRQACLGRAPSSPYTMVRMSLDASPDLLPWVALASVGRIEVDGESRGGVSRGEFVLADGTASAAVSLGVLCGGGSGAPTAGGPGRHRIAVTATLVDGTTTAPAEADVDFACPTEITDEMVGCGGSGGGSDGSGVSGASAETAPDGRSSSSSGCGMARAADGQGGALCAAGVATCLLALHRRRRLARRAAL